MLLCFWKRCLHDFDSQQKQQSTAFNKYDKIADQEHRMTIVAHPIPVKNDTVDKLI